MATIFWAVWSKLDAILQIPDKGDFPMSVQPRNTKAERTRRTVRKTVIITAMILAVLFVVVMVLRQRVDERAAAGNQENIRTAQVTTGSIRTTVSGSGTLVSEGLEDVKLPAGVEIDETLVEEGDMVHKGDILATVKIPSVRAALADTQDKLDEVDTRLKNAASDKVSTQISARVAGRIKGVFAEKDEDVATVMYDHGCLALLSLDGYMALELEDAPYALGDTVTVTTQDGTEYEGTVDSVRAGKATILITDDGPQDGEEVRVDGTYTANLYIHQPMKITGYAGTVANVNVKENDKVSAYSVLFTLKDTQYTANYDSALEERAELEETLQTLIGMYQDGAVYAPVDGIIDSIPEEEDDQSAAVSAAASSASLATMAQSASTSTQTASGQDAQEDEKTLLLTIDPYKEMRFAISVDETNIRSLAVGQEVTVEVESVGDKTYSGTVCQIDTTPASAGGVTNYTATISLDAQDGMMAGMTAEASVTIQGIENAMLLPEEAVRRTSTSAFVYTSFDAQTGKLGGMVQVQTGISNGSEIEIIQGLNPGDTVYYEKTFDFFSFMFGGQGMDTGMGGGGMHPGAMGPGRNPG